MAFFKPERYFKRITDIDVQSDIAALGFTHVLVDVDNTIRSREDGLVPDDVQEWLEEAARAGVTVCLFSNNWHDNVFELGRQLDLPVVAKAMKPLPYAYFHAKRQVGCPLGTTLAIGDQLLTDICGAHVLGVTAYLVEPLAQKDLRHTVVLRRLERKLMGPLQPE